MSWEENSIVFWNDVFGNVEPESFATQCLPKTVSCSANVGCFVTNKNEVYQLPLFDADANTPTLMKPLVKHEVSNAVVINDNYYIMLLSDTNNTVLKLDKNGELLEEIKFENDTTSNKQIYCGDDFILFKNVDDNQIFGLGSNEFGQLAKRPNNFPSTTAPIPLEIKVKEEIISIDVGRHHAVFLTKPGCIYSWGDNRSGQCGYDAKKIPMLTRPTRVKRKDNDFDGYVQCSAFEASCFLHSDGKVLLFYETGPSILTFPEKVSWVGTGKDGIVFAFNPETGVVYYYSNGEYKIFPTDCWDLISVQLAGDGNGIIGIGRENSGLSSKQPAKQKDTAKEEVSVPPSSPEYSRSVSPMSPVRMSPSFSRILFDSPAMEIRSQEDLTLLENSVTSFSQEIRVVNEAIDSERAMITHLLTTVAAQRQMTLGELANRCVEESVLSKLEQCADLMERLADLRASYFEAAENVCQQ
eukprot:gene783-932_t